MVNPAEMAVQRPGEKPSSFSLTCSLLSQYLKEKGGFGDLGVGISAATAPTVEARGRPELLWTMNLLAGVESADDMAANRDAASDGKNESDRSVDLSPPRAGFGTCDKKKPDLIREPQKAQMTIFYGGKVVVLDNFPADKARELMIMAGRAFPAAAQRFRAEQPAPAPQRPCCHPPAQHTSATAVAAAAPEAKSAGAPTPAVISQGAPQKPPHPAASAMPIARKVSLQRFLQKRKDRISAKAPYAVHSPSSPMGSSASSSAPPTKPEVKRQWLGLAPPVSRPEDLRG